jgi:hypothetical protein
VIRHWSVLCIAGTQFLYTDRYTGNVLQYDLSTMSSSLLVELSVLVSTGPLLCDKVLKAYQKHIDEVRWRKQHVLYFVVRFP